MEILFLFDGEPKKPEVKGLMRRTLFLLSLNGHFRGCEDTQARDRRVYESNRPVTLKSWASTASSFELRLTLAKRRCVWFCCEAPLTTKAKLDSFRRMTGQLWQVCETQTSGAELLSR